MVSIPLDYSRSPKRAITVPVILFLFVFKFSSAVPKTTMSFCSHEHTCFWYNYKKANEYMVNYKLQNNYLKFILKLYFKSK